MIDAVMDAAKVMRGELTKEDLVFKPEGDSIRAQGTYAPPPHRRSREAGISARTTR